MNYRILIVLLVLSSTTNLAHAQDRQDKNTGEALVKIHHCYPCHDMSKALIGPPFQAIAVRHQAKGDVMIRVLAEKIIRGGGGNWGVVPMVPNEQVNQQDAEILARWILQQNP